MLSFATISQKNTFNVCKQLNGNKKNWYYQMYLDTFLIFNVFSSLRKLIVEVKWQRLENQIQNKVVAKHFVNFQLQKVQREKNILSIIVKTGIINITTIFAFAIFSIANQKKLYNTKTICKKILQEITKKLDMQ